MACLQTCALDLRIVRSRAGRDALFPLGREGKKKQRGSSGAMLCRIESCPGRRRAGAGARSPRAA